MQETGLYGQYALLILLSEDVCNRLKACFLLERAMQIYSYGLIDSCSKNVAIDGHVIRSCSWLNDLAEPGYKMGPLKAPQVKVLVAFDVNNKLPLMYLTYRGSSVDKKSVVDFLVSRSFTDTNKDLKLLAEMYEMWK